MVCPSTEPPQCLDLLCGPHRVRCCYFVPLGGNKTTISPPLDMLMASPFTMNSANVSPTTQISGYLTPSLSYTTTSMFVFGSTVIAAILPLPWGAPMKPPMNLLKNKLLANIILFFLLFFVYSTISCFSSVNFCYNIITKILVKSLYSLCF